MCVYMNQTLNQMVNLLTSIYYYYYLMRFEELVVSVMTNCGSLVLEPSYNVTRFKSTISHKNTSNKYKQYKIH